MPAITPRPLKIDVTKCFSPADYIEKKEPNASLRNIYRRMKGEASPPLPTVEISNAEFIYLG